MDGNLLAAILTAVGFILGLASQWGKSRSVEKRHADEIEHIKQILGNLPTEYVTLRHFEYVASEMKDNLRTVQTDVKEILRRIKQ